MWMGWSANARSGIAWRAAWYLISERLATIFPNVAISDARKIAEYYLERYGKRSEFIPYGAEVGALPDAEVLEKLDLQRAKYFLYVSRMEPENNALLVREAFEKVSTSLKLALIGDAPYADAYIQRVRATNDPRIVIPERSTDAVITNYSRTVTPTFMPLKWAGRIRR